jgi:hypothetical protein
MQKLSLKQALAWRLHRQYLDRRAPRGSMLAVAARLCGLHAQVMSSAELSLWARVEQLDRESVSRALWQDRTLVKTWAMRGTLHLLPSSDLPLWHAALTTSRRYSTAALWARFGMTLDDLEGLTNAIGAALNGKILTREELAIEVGRVTGNEQYRNTLAQSSWGTLLKPAAFTGRLCFAPSAGLRVRFTRPDTWLESGLPPADAPTAAAEITRRYLTAYGPATLEDFARWWGGAGMAAVRKWIVALGDEVVPVDLDGARAWMLAKDYRRARKLAPPRAVRLLPGFDQYVVAASRYAEQLLPVGVSRVRIFRPQGWISPVLLVNGRIDGVWRHEIKGKRVEVAIEPFRDLPSWIRRAAALEAERLAGFLGGSLTLTWKDA